MNTNPWRLYAYAWLMVAILVLMHCLSGCAAVGADYGRIEHEHISHPFAGAPFGPGTEEDSLDQISAFAGWKKGRYYAEAGLGYKMSQHGFYGPRLTFTGRVGYQFGDAR